MRRFGYLGQVLRVTSTLVIGALATWNGAQATATTNETITFAVNSFGGEEFDPVIAKAELISYAAIMFDSLFNVDAKNQLTPGLAKSWEVSPDAKTWTIHLRDDVVFHDGSPFTADDVKFSIEHSEIDEAQRGALWRSVLGDPNQIEILDPYTVRITMPQPQPNFAEFATHKIPPYMFILPKAYIEKNGIDYFRKHPIGTGPYKFVRAVTGQEVDFDAVDYKHWRVDPAFQHVKILEVPEETTRVAMLETGQIDATNVNLENGARLKASGYTLAYGDEAYANINFIGSYLPEAKGKPLSDIRVREALSLAINRQEIADTLLAGFGSADIINEGVDWDNKLWTPELIAKWKPLLAKAYRYDPEEAKRLIAEAGYSGGFEFEFWVPPESSAPYLPDLMQAVAGYWEAVGAHVKLVQVDSTAWRGVRHTSNSMRLVGAGGTNVQGMKPVAEDSFIFHTSKYGNMNVLTGSPLEPKVDQLVLAGWSSVDPVEHSKIFDQLLDLTTYTWTAWPIVKAPSVVAFGPRVTGDVKYDLQNEGYNISYWAFTGAAVQ